jgi:hypothetical protein
MTSHPIFNNGASVSSEPINHHGVFIHSSSARCGILLSWAPQWRAQFHPVCLRLHRLQDLSEQPPIPNRFVHDRNPRSNHLHRPSINSVRHDRILDLAPVKWNARLLPNEPIEDFGAFSEKSHSGGIVEEAVVMNNEGVVHDFHEIARPDIVQLQDAGLAVVFFGARIIQIAHRWLNSGICRLFTSFSRVVARGARRSLSLLS